MCKLAPTGGWAKCVADFRSLTKFCRQAITHKRDSELFRVEGKTYSADQASSKVRTLLYDLDLQYYEQRQALADEFLLELYANGEAAKRGVSTAALARELLPRVSATGDRHRGLSAQGCRSGSIHYRRVR